MCYKIEGSFFYLRRQGKCLLIGKGDDVYLNLVMDYIPDTLSKVIRYYKKAKQPFPAVLLKIYSY